MGDSIQMDHRTISIASNETNKGFGHNFNISYVYRNLSRFIFLNSSMGFSCQPKTWNNYTNIQPRFNTLSWAFPFYSNNYYFNSTADKFFNNINSRFKIRYNLNIGKRNLIYNDTHFVSKHNTNNIRIEYGSSFEGLFNFFINIDYQKSTFRLSDVENINVQKQSQQELKIKMTTPSNKTTIGLSMKNNHFNNNIFKGYFYDIDLEINYRIKRQGFKLSLTNILNRKEWNESINNSLYSNTSSYDLVPFFLLLEWKTSFSGLKNINIRRQNE